MRTAAAPGAPERAWRLADLARLAGITPQQVRNYGAAGLLPAAPRGANGYRRFTQQHADALVTVRLLAEGHGWAATRQVMSAVHTGDLRTALAVVDGSHAALTREREQVAATSAAFATTAAAAAGRLPAQATIGEVARHVGVQPAVLRLWEERGLLQPTRAPGTGYRQFDRTEQRTAHLVAVLRRGAFPFPVIVEAVATLRASGDPARARTALRRRDDDLHRTSLRRLRASAALSDYLATHVEEPLSP